MQSIVVFKVGLLSYEIIKMTMRMFIVHLNNNIASSSNVQSCCTKYNFLHIRVKIQNVFVIIIGVPRFNMVQQATVIDIDTQKYDSNDNKKMLMTK